MSIKVYSYTHGSCTSEQNFITQIDLFLTTTLGWVRLDTVSDTASDRDYVWSSTGEDEERGTVYIRLRGYDDKIYEYGYGSWTSSAVYGHEIYNASTTYIITESRPFRFWAFGDKNFICFTVYDGIYHVPYTGYAGFIRSYYAPEKDKIPLMIRGQNNEVRSWSYTPYCYMHTANASGVAEYNTYTVWTSMLQFDDNTRSTGLSIWPFPLYYTGVGFAEVRGEPYGVYQVNGKGAGNNSIITTTSGVFIVYKNNNDTSRTFAYGPIASASGIVGFEDY